METTRQQRIFFKIYPYLLLATGVTGLAQWVYGGRKDVTALLAGVGFLLVVAAAYLVRKPNTTLASRGYHLVVQALGIGGLALVVTATAWHLYSTSASLS